MRTVLGADAVDYPRKDVLYADSPWRKEAHRLYGAGFNCFGLAEQSIDRTDLARKVETGHFDAIINSNAEKPGWLGRRSWRSWLERALTLHTRALDS